MKTLAQLNNSITSLNETQLNAMMMSERFHADVQRALQEVLFEGWSVAHVSNRKGQAVLAFRVRDDVLTINDASGADITDMYRMVSAQRAH